MLADPLGALMELPGVGRAMVDARDAVAAVTGIPAQPMSHSAVHLGRGVPCGRTEPRPPLDDGTPRFPATGRSASGAPLARCGSRAFGSLLGGWRRAPLHLLAQLHMLAAVGLAPEA